MYIWSVYFALGRAPINRPVSRESSSSPNLVSDRAAHPVCAITIAAPLSRGLDSIAPHLSDSQLAATEWLSAALVDSVSLCIH